MTSYKVCFQRKKQFWYKNLPLRVAIDEDKKYFSIKSGQSVTVELAGGLHNVKMYYRWHHQSKWHECFWRTYLPRPKDETKEFDIEISKPELSVLVKFDWNGLKHSVFMPGDKLRGEDIFDF